MLGWIYQALFALLLHTFGSTDRFYNRLFWVTQLAVIGMLVSFPIQGYGSVSIPFSTLHILCSYVFVVRFWRRLRSENRIATKFLRTALIFLVVSTIGLWSMGPLMALGMRGTALYYMSVQFYLHFQFNGWFLFTVIGLFFHLVQAHGLTL